jgi:geranylgeranyl diphosphate synthase type I
MNEALSREEGEGRTPVERKLRELLFDPDESALDPGWTRAQALVSELALRPAKRLRPKLLHAGYLAGGGTDPAPDGFWTFATGLEVLHTFMLIHDDVADQSAIRRGGPALHPSMGPGRLGENLAVVAGDHLFARAVELLFTAPLRTAPAAAAYYLKVCRHTAVGQFLDIELGRRAWSEITPFDALKVAELKTAQYSVAAPLGCGAMLAGASTASVETLQRLGRFAGVAFQLQDDLAGLFGDPLATGKPTDCDLRECKKSFPLLLAYRRATSRERRCLERLGAEASPEELERVKAIVHRRGGVTGTRRAVDRAMAAARRVLREGPLPPEQTADLETLLSGLVAPSTEPSVSALGGARASIDLHPGVDRRPGGSPR